MSGRHPGRDAKSLRQRAAETLLRSSRSAVPRCRHHFADHVEDTPSSARPPQSRGRRSAMERSRSSSASNRPSSTSEALAQCRSSRITIAAPAFSSARAFSSWCAADVRKAGRAPTACRSPISSAMLVAPARQTARRARAYTAGMSSMKAVNFGRRCPPRRRRGPRRTKGLPTWWTMRGGSSVERRVEGREARRAMARLRLRAPALPPKTSSRSRDFGRAANASSSRARSGIAGADDLAARKRRRGVSKLVQTASARRPSSGWRCPAGGSARAARRECRRERAASTAGADA